MKFTLQFYLYKIKNCELILNMNCLCNTYAERTHYLTFFLLLLLFIITEL